MSDAPETKHTPGAWVVSENVNDTHDQPFTEYCVEDAAGNIVGLFTHEAYARLIAAAPELLAALESIFQYAEAALGPKSPEIKNAAAAIVKAKGGAA